MFVVKMYDGDKTLYFDGRRFVPERAKARAYRSEPAAWRALGRQFGEDRWNEHEDLYTDEERFNVGNVVFTNA